MSYMSYIFFKCSIFILLLTSFTTCINLDKKYSAYIVPYQNNPIITSWFKYLRIPHESTTASDDNVETFNEFNLQVPAREEEFFDNIPTKKPMDSWINSNPNVNLLLKSESKLNSMVKLQSSQITKEKISYNCIKNDSNAQQICLEYCTHLKDYKEGICSQDQQACICRTLGSNSIRVKLFKPVGVENIIKTPTQIPSSKKVIIDRGDFDCDGSLEANSICQVYCDLGRISSTLSKCTMDGKSCICYSTIFSGKKMSSSSTSNIYTDKTFPIERHIIQSKRGRNMIGIGNDIVEEKVVSSIGDRVQSRGGGPILQSRSPQRLPYLPGCNSYSCLGKCPRHCDSLCTMSMECFCSCPEDATYSDYGFGPPGPGPIEALYTNSYDYPLYG